MTDGPDLGLVHRIDQAQASAFQRTENLIEWVNDWLCNQGFTDEQISDALNEPMMFMALLKIMTERVAVHELPNMCAALIIRIARERFERGRADGG